MMGLTLVAASASAAIVYVAHNGNSSSNWLPVCQQFGDFCEGTSGAVVASFIAAALLMCLVILSAFALKRSTWKSAFVSIKFLYALIYIHLCESEKGKSRKDVWFGFVMLCNSGCIVNHVVNQSFIFCIFCFPFAYIIVVSKRTNFKLLFAGLYWKISFNIFFFGISDLWHKALRVFR